MQKPGENFVIRLIILVLIQRMLEISMKTFSLLITNLQMASLIHHITSTSHMHVQIQWLQLFLASDFGFYFIFEEIPCLLIKDLYIYLPVPSFSTA